MAGELSQKETEVFYGISAEFENFDCGLDAFNTKLGYVTGQLNDWGGRQSPSYNGIIAQLNDEWENLDQTARLTGRVYMFDTGIVELVDESWDGPHRDARGTYFVVDGVELVSLGIVDGLANSPPIQQEDGSLSFPINLGYGFSTEESDSDYPMFYALPEDILRAEYDEPTYDAIESRLHYRWPKLLRFIDTHLEGAGDDPMKTLAALRHITRRAEADCIDSPELRDWLLKYLRNNTDFDQDNPYQVTLQGDGLMMPIQQGNGEVGNVKNFTADQAVTRNLRLDAIGSRFFDGKDGRIRFEFGLVFDEPTSRYIDEGVASKIMLPVNSIRDMRSTRPVSSLWDLVTDSQQEAEEAFASEHTEEDDRVEFVKPATEYVHRQILEEQRLEQYQALIKDAIKRVKAARTVRYRDPKEALAESARLSQQLAEEFLQLNLKQTDLLQVAGGARKAAADLTTAPGKFHLDIDMEDPIVTPKADTEGYGYLGYFDGMFAAAASFEDNEGPFWLVAPQMRLIVNQVAQPVAVADEFVYVRAMVVSAASVNLDGSADFSLPHLERLQRRKQALADAALHEHGTKLLNRLVSIDRGFMHEDPVETVTAKDGLLRNIRSAARDIIEGNHETGLEALREQLIERRVALTGEAWVGPSWLGGKHADSLKCSGDIQEVIRVTVAGQERVLALVQPTATQTAGGGERVWIALDSLTELMF